MTFDEWWATLTPHEQKVIGRTNARYVWVCAIEATQKPRSWVGLTKEEAKEISMANRPYVVDMIAALEARLKEKNT